jgi:prepilin-type N-terminal cleavage/methylation domain-containing protein
MKIISKKGFTLVEILIVIVIIGLLSVLFVPKLLSAPARARDRQRVDDVKSLASYYQDLYLNNPTATLPNGCLTTTGTGALNISSLASKFGGRVPTDPKRTTGSCSGPDEIGYRVYSCAADRPYKFVVSAQVEDPKTAGNALSYRLGTGNASYCTAKLVNPVVHATDPAKTSNFFAIPVQK